jgi:hypothetical protein
MKMKESNESNRIIVHLATSKEVMGRPHHQQHLFANRCCSTNVVFIFKAAGPT